MMTVAIAILAKAPQPGLAKTRLAPLLGARGAARAQRGFTLHTLRTAREAALGPVTLWCAPDVTHRFFRALAGRCSLTCRAQPPGDLGDRMRHVVDTHFAAGPEQPLLLMGTDCAVLTAVHLRQAADALRAQAAVLIPAEDGGYVLLGLKRPVPGLFDGVAWSTDRVLAQTRDRLRTAGVRWMELPTLWDVDEPADWQRLQRLDTA